MKNNMIKAIIIEDEELAASRLKELIESKHHNIEIVKILPSIKKSIHWLQENNPDLIFLDILLSDGLSFKIFDKVTPKAPIIFTTAYDKYALKAFKLNSVDYLLKPINPDELNDAIEKFIKNKIPTELDIVSILQSMNQKRKEYKKRFLVQIGNKIKTVSSERVALFYAFDKSVYLMTNDKQKYIIDFSLDKLAEILDEDLFFRINRKLIINRNSISSMEAYSRGRIFIKLNYELPEGIDTIVSVNRSSQFKSWLDR